jgi:hypothetical protein
MQQGLTGAVCLRDISSLYGITAYHVILQGCAGPCADVEDLRGVGALLSWKGPAQ